MSAISPTLVPLGDAALLVRLGTTTLSEPANRAAIALAGALADQPPQGVLEVVPNLVSVLVRYDPRHIDYLRLTGELRLLIGAGTETGARTTHAISVRFDGEDLSAVAASLNLTPDGFIEAHNVRPLCVLATGFAPGFVYCGFHPKELVIARRTTVRPMVPAGTVLFAAGQTAIAATPIPTGWHVIGHTDFSNFDPYSVPPTTLAPGDELRFEVLA